MLGFFWVKFSTQLLLTMNIRLNNFEDTRHTQVETINTIGGLPILLTACEETPKHRRVAEMNGSAPAAADLPTRTTLRDRIKK